MNTRIVRVARGTTIVVRPLRHGDVDTVLAHALVSSDNPAALALMRRTLEALEIPSRDASSGSARR